MNPTAYQQACRAMDGSHSVDNVAEHDAQAAIAYGLGGIASAIASLTFELSRTNDLYAKAHNIDEDE